MDDLKVLIKTGDYLLLGVQAILFVGGMTDWNRRQMELDLSFLPSGEYSMEIFQDGINADKHAQDYKHLKSNVKSGDKLKIEMAPGGGWVAKISSK
jgi:alpha-glucosidase